MTIAVNIGGNIFQGISGHQGGDPGGVFHIFDHAPHFAPGLIDTLALLGGQNGGDFFKIFLKSVFEPEQITGAGQWRSGAPIPVSIFGSFNRLIHILFGPVANLGDFFCCGRIPNISKSC